MSGNKIPVEKIKLAYFERFAKANEEINRSVADIRNFIQIQGQSHQTVELSKAARYVIWWLTQIETDVYDSEVQIQRDQNSYKDKIANRKLQKPTENCRHILREYKDLLENFDGLFDTEKIKAKTLDELQKYLDPVGQQIVSLKQMVAAKVKDSPDTEACIIPPQKSQVTQSKRS